MPTRSAPRRRARTSRGRIVVRWLAVAALALVSFLYYRPLQSYLDTRERVEARAAEVARLDAQKRALERRLAASATDLSLIREARKLSYVKPGERLFIVKGIAQWRREQAQRRRASTIGGDG